MAASRTHGLIGNAPVRVRRASLGVRLACVVAIGPPALLQGCAADSPRPGPATSSATPVADVCAQPAVAPHADSSIQAMLDKVTDASSGGVVVALSKDGGPVRYCAAGRADRAGTLLEPEHVFRIGSITKTFTAVLVMQLVEEGRLSLQAPVEPLLPGVPWTSGVTVEQLLNHTSGIPDYADRRLQDTLVADGEQEWTPLEALGVIDGWAREFEPGAEQEYSNTNYVLLGLVVEAVTGQQWPQVLKERIVDPLRLTSTAPGGDGPEPVTGFTTAFTDRDTEGDAYRSMETAAGAAGGMVSTAHDLVTFLTALARGDLVEAGTLRLMTTFTPVEDPWYGLGLERVDFPSGPGYGHGGEIPGFRSLAAVQAEADDMVVVLTNDENVAAFGLERLFAAW